MAVVYEWVIEWLDGPDTDEVEIIDVDHADTYTEAVARAAQHDHARVGLVRDRDTFHGLCRSWAYVKDGVLPEWLEDAFFKKTVKVPVRYRAQFDKAAQ